MTKQRNIGVVYEEYVDALFAYARHLGLGDDSAMDVVHDVFFKFYSRDDEIESIVNLKFYLFRSLKNRIIDLARTDKKITDSIDWDEQIAERLPFNFSITIEDELIEKEQQDEIRLRLENVLSKLTDRQREIIYLRYIHEYEYDEISELMQISVKSCRNLLSKSLGKLSDSGQIMAVLTLLFRGIS